MPKYPTMNPASSAGFAAVFSGIAPTTANVYVWMEQGRTDILRWFVAFLENGSTPVNCADLKPEDLGGVVVFEMRNPDTGTM